MGRAEIHSMCCGVNMKEKDYLEDLGVDWRIILEEILKKNDGALWTRSMWLGAGTSGGLL
jgi:hypothetical protein